MKYLSVDTLTFAEYNPRSIKDNAFKKLKENISRDREFFEARPCLINERDGKLVVYAGNQRLRAAIDLGWKEVPCIVHKIPLALEKERNIKDNRLQGDWDFDALSSHFELGDLKNWGFSDQELALVDTDPTNEDAPPPVPKKARSKPGDLYLLGPHRVLCGDATEAKSYEKLMGGDTAQMVFCDPPYNVAYEGGSATKSKREQIMNDSMDKGPFHAFLKAALEPMMERMSGAIYIFMSEQEMPILRSAFHESGGKWSQNIIWVKSAFTLGRSDWQNQYEPILYGWPARVKNHYFAGFRDEGNVWENLEKAVATYDGQKTILKLGQFVLEIEGQVAGRVMKKRDQVDIWYEKKPTKNTEHPTMKPVALCAKAIRASSTPGKIVLDPFLGSGSTLMAADETGRICHGMELDPKYVDVIVTRYCEKHDIDPAKVFKTKKATPEAE